MERKNTDFKAVLKKYFFHQNELSSLTPLVDVLKSIRKANFSEFVEFLQNEKNICENFRNYIHLIFKEKSFNLSLTEAGILSEAAFLPELKKRALGKLLPPVEQEDTIWYLVDNVCPSPARDLHMLKSIDSEKLQEFLGLMQVSDFIKTPFVRKELLLSVNILMWRIMGSAMDTAVVNMIPEYRNFDSPFVALQNEIDHMNGVFSEDPEYWFTSDHQCYKQIKIYLQQCESYVSTAFKNSATYGINVKINDELLKIQQQLRRIKEILWLLVIDQPTDFQRKSIGLVFDVLKYKSHRNNIKELVDDNTRLLSHLITNHTGEIGLQYISSSYREYILLFRKSLGGGAIIGVLCVLMLLLRQLQGSEFSHGFLFALNFAGGFIAIYLMRFLLATRQPAMTAATMAKVLSENQNPEDNYKEFAHLISRLMRSQFISFIGNIFTAFGIAMILMYGLDVLFNLNFAKQDAGLLLKRLDPVQSRVIFHASITGVFIFLAGIITGNTGNNLVYYQIPRRISNSTWIIGLFGRQGATNISGFVQRNWAGIVANFWFGVFLGAINPIGIFLGVDLDFRHMTIAAGDFALGLYGKAFAVTTNVFWISFISIFLIGFLNFWVSFGLSIVLAFRSRKVKFEDTRKIMSETFKYFMKNPLKFFFPIQSYLDSRAQEMMEKTTTKK